MKTTSLLACLAAAGALASPTLSLGMDPPPPAAPVRSVDDAAVAKVQLALLLDTSGSMQGLIHQARSQLWKIINEFNASTRGGRTPEVEVALYEYGNNGSLKENHWLRCVTPFTRDLDEVSRRLFELSTNGGEEYCGAVIRHALDSLRWSREPGVYKAIFIAGNEPFTQGPVDALEACKAAAGAGVRVNTIHCGPAEEGLNGGWKAGALIADGSYLVINHNAEAKHVEAPQDKEIVRLGLELNRTYLGYGAQAKSKSENQLEQDANAAAVAPAAPIARALTKASENYDNRSWDLVDAVKKGGLKLEEVKREELAPELQKMTPEELRGRVEQRAAEREALRAKIQTLQREREAWLAKEEARAKSSGAAAAEPETLDTAVIKAVRAQAAKLNFEWRKP